MVIKNRFPAATTLATKKVMRANRRKNTQPELRVRRIVHASGLRYRVDYRPEESLNRRGDLVFLGSKVVVFIHGCFWHGCPKHFSAPKSNRSFWKTKIDTNRKRDKETQRYLQKKGWKVVTIWEHSSPEKAAAKIIEIVNKS